MLKIMYRIANITEKEQQVFEKVFPLEKIFFTNKRDPASRQLCFLDSGDDEKYIDSNNYDAEKDCDDFIRESIYELAHDLWRWREGDAWNCRERQL